MLAYDSETGANEELPRTRLPEKERMGFYVDDGAQVIGIRARA